METSREVIFENVRLGFAAAYDSLVSDASQRVSFSTVINHTHL